MYNAMKAQLIDRFSESEKSQLRKILKEIELGDQKPFHLLTKMHQLASGKVSDDLLKTLWFQHSPSQIVAILSTSADSLNNTVSMGDKVIFLSNYAIDISGFKNKFGHIASAENLSNAIFKKS